MEADDPYFGGQGRYHSALSLLTRNNDDSTRRNTITTEFRTLDDGARLPDNYVNPYYLEDLKRRVAVARVGGKLFASDDLYEGCPLTGGLLTGTTLMSQCDGSQFEVASGESVQNRERITNNRPTVEQEKDEV